MSCFSVHRLPSNRGDSPGKGAGFLSSADLGARLPKEEGGPFLAKGLGSNCIQNDASPEDFLKTELLEAPFHSRIESPAINLMDGLAECCSLGREGL